MISDQLKRKIALGTVQLGLPYGIHNQTGKPNEQEAFRILNSAVHHQISLLDSAEAYGSSLQVIGAYLKENKGADLHIISKFIDDGSSLQGKIENSLLLLGCSQLYAFMYHRFKDYLSGNCKSELLQLKNEGKIKNLGVSVYGTSELELALDDPDLSVIQIPLNPFDNTPLKKSLLKKAKDKGKEIHVRSVFLQGLFFKKPDELIGNLKGLRSSLESFHSVLVKYNLNVRQACLNYALQQRTVDYVIIGVETETQLTENIGAILPQFYDEISEALESAFDGDPSLLNPSNWKP